MMTTDKFLKHLEDILIVRPKVRFSKTRFWIVFWTVF
jgi:hypothetical protein